MPLLVNTAAGTVNVPAARSSVPALLNEVNPASEAEPLVSIVPVLLKAIAGPVRVNVLRLIRPLLEKVSSPASAVPPVRLKMPAPLLANESAPAPWRQHRR